tara:strand:- start:150 stop:275 length:126 start_codon:yes stop_codon:yes gene_type:complete
MLKRFFKNKKQWLPGALIIFFLLLIVLFSKMNFGSIGYSIF